MEFEDGDSWGITAPYDQIVNINENSEENYMRNISKQRVIDIRVSKFVFG